VDNFIGYYGRVARIVLELEGDCGINPTLANK
jgi:hypothetical protein